MLNADDQAELRTSPYSSHLPHLHTRKCVSPSPSVWCSPPRTTADLANSLGALNKSLRSLARGVFGREMDGINCPGHRHSIGPLSTPRVGNRLRTNRLSMRSNANAMLLAAKSFGFFAWLGPSRCVERILHSLQPLPKPEQPKEQVPKLKIPVTMPNPQNVRKI